MTTFVDPIEQRDPWRTLWQLFTSDALLIVLCIVVIGGWLAAVVLPQTPAVGTADPVAYSRWEAQAKLREGALYDSLSGLGLNNVAQTAWWRISLAGLAAITGIRLADRITRLIAARKQMHTDALRDETRVRVMLNAPPLNDLATQLRAQRYRVTQPNRDTLIADRTPWAEVLSLVLHLGLLLVVLGVLLNLLLGWETNNRAIVSGASTPLHNDYAVSLTGDEDASHVGLALHPGDVPVKLAIGQSANTGFIGGINLALRQVTPGYRMSANTTNDEPLFIRASNFVSPTTEVLLTFTEDDPERYVAVPDARLALQLSAGSSLDQPGRLRAFAIPSGEVITDTLIQPEMVVNDATFRFKPTRGAVIDASHRPGDPIVWLGAALTLIGMVGALIYPMRRILVQHHGHWTEFYASGRGVRQTIAKLIESRK